MKTRLLLRKQFPTIMGMFLLTLLLAYYGFTDEQFNIDKKTLQWAKDHHGAKAADALTTWEKLIREDDSPTEHEKLIKVNNFFNKVEFLSDAVHWNEEDYWATPVEFLASNGGDCEDFSFAKYFTLKAMGIADKKLNLTYVRAVQLQQAHMVLTYIVTPGAEPLVLDNLIDEIKPASKRTDLIPVYSFNATGLWIAKQRGRGKLVGKSTRLGRWQGLLKRMPKGLIR